MLSPEVESRLEAARANETAYRPHADIAARLGEKVLIMLVGPAATGKSYIMNLVAERDSRFRRVPIFSTRAPRPDDEPGMFRCYPHDDENVSRLLDNIDARRVVQYAVHPTQGTIYGTLAEDYPGEFNMLATLSGAVDHMRSLPFKDVRVVGMATRPDDWQAWFDARYPADHSDRLKRINEAIISLEWLLDESQQETVLWIPNMADQADGAADAIISVATHQYEADDLALRDYAQSTLERARAMLRNV